MKTTSVLAIVAVFGLAVLWHQGHPGSAVAQSQFRVAPKNKIQWDYAELSAKYAIRTTSEEREQQNLQFSSRELNAKEIGWTALARKLGVKTDSGTRQLVFDHLGSQGWELVAATAPTYARGEQQPGFEFYWHFKRERQ